MFDVTFKNFYEEFINEFHSAQYLPDFDDQLEQGIIKTSRQAEKYRLPTHANYFKWEKRFDIRPHLSYFAGIGIEKLYYFYTHVLHQLDVEYVPNDIDLLLDDWDENGKKFKLHDRVWYDMLMMVKNPLFVRKLRQLDKYTEYDFKVINNRVFRAVPSIIKEMRSFGFDRRQALYFIVDIALHSFQEPMEINEYKIFTVKNLDPFADLLYYQILSDEWPRKFRAHALKTQYTHKVQIPNTDEFLYELDFEKIQEHNQMVFNFDKFEEEVINRAKISYERFKRRERKKVKSYYKVRHHKAIKLDKKNKMTKKGVLD